ncbi:phage filamentation protein Fil family protein [Yersinia kristensenii]|uniref:phage filamentation protein Fil family protein n=1 Tax=Yersinia kristensenii TaxID=28152 RepID=UPI0011A53D18|nr:phage filamentation protein Fil family protein [Yersinia kristensenii]
MNEPIPSIPSILKSHCEVTHFKPLRGWIETPDGRFLKPDPQKVRFIKEESKPVIYTCESNKRLKRIICNFLKKYL